VQITTVYNAILHQTSTKHNVTIGRPTHVEGLSKLLLTAVLYFWSPCFNLPGGRASKVYLVVWSPAQLAKFTLTYHTY